MNSGGRRGTPHKGGRAAEDGRLCFRELNSSVDGLSISDAIVISSNLLT
jgi:hypothetical protein